jgi:chromosome segregation ATPase
MSNTGTPIKPTKIMVSSGSGTPGKFTGKNYKTAPTKKEKAALTDEISQKLAQISDIRGQPVVEKQGLEQINITTLDAQRQIEKLQSEVSELQKQGGNLQKAQIEQEKLRLSLTQKNIDKALPGPT